MAGKRRTRRKRRQTDQTVVVALAFVVAVVVAGAAALSWLAGDPGAVTTLTVVVVLVVGGTIWWKLRQGQRRRDRAAAAKQALLQHQRGLGNLLTLTPHQFEVVIATLLEALGYTQVIAIGKAGDLGVDLTCVTPDGFAAVVQCKRWGPGRRVGTPDLQSFNGMVFHHRAQVGVYITTATFTAPALKLASEMGTRLIDGYQLTALFDQVNGIAPPAPPPPPPAPVISPDGQSWWDGASWQPIAQSTPRT
jgi:restriction system protein